MVASLNSGEALGVVSFTAKGACLVWEAGRCICFSLIQFSFAIFFIFDNCYWDQIMSGK
jgi:hypothetical protein